MHCTISEWMKEVLKGKHSFEGYTIAKPTASGVKTSSYYSLVGAFNGFRAEHPDSLTLNHCSLYNQDLQGINLDNLVCLETDLSKTNLNDVSLREAHITRSTLYKTTMKSARAPFSRFDGCVIATDFTDANLRCAQFANCDFTTADKNYTAAFSGANLYSAKFIDCNGLDTLRGLDVALLRHLLVMPKKSRAVFEMAHEEGKRHLFRK